MPTAIPTAVDAVDDPLGASFPSRAWDTPWAEKSLELATVHLWSSRSPWEPRALPHERPLSVVV
jgi:hypothetical protein